MAKISKLPSQQWSKERQSIDTCALHFSSEIAFTLRYSNIQCGNCRQILSSFLERERERERERRRIIMSPGLRWLLQNWGQTNAARILENSPNLAGGPPAWAGAGVGGGGRHQDKKFGKFKSVKVYRNVMYKWSADCVIDRGRFYQKLGPFHRKVGKHSQRAQSGKIFGRKSGCALPI